MHSRPLLVVQTWYCETRTGGRYVVELARPDRPRGPRLVLSTTDRDLYQDALDAEGWPEPVIAHYSDVRGHLVLEALTPAPFAMELPR